MEQGSRNRNQGRTEKKEHAAPLAALLVIGVVFIAEASSRPRVEARLEPESGPLIFRTSDSQFDAGVNNQGWWSAGEFGFDSNDNYVTGTVTASGGVETRDFFTFDLRSLDLSGRILVSAVLEVDRGGRGDDPTETLALFEVSTDAATLNNNTGTSATIFDDLGTGTVYGTYIARFDGPQFGGRAAFRLNQAAITAISEAAGGFFSIGGALQSLPGYLFGGTGGGDQRLVLCLDTDPDVDMDGVCDEVDNCSATANPEQGDVDGDRIGDVCDDSDGDGILDEVDNCPFAANPGQEDTDADGRGNSCDFCEGPGAMDTDGDGVCNEVDNCRYIPNPSQSDGDGDGPGDACDNCPGVPNPDQIDSDRNGIGDACALCPPYEDLDGDNVCDAADNCFVDHNPDQADADGDGFGDACDACAGAGRSDCEGDGACDETDNCLCVPNPDQADDDGEGVGDACDNCPETPNLDQANADGDGLGDACDSCPADPLDDLDGDGVCGNVDNCPSAFNPGQEDSDGNGVGDACTGGRSLVVNSLADAADDRPGDGFCATAQDECTLRAAVQETNALFGADVINVPAGTYVLSLEGAGENAGASGDLDITDDLALVGEGPGTTVIDAAFQGASQRDRAIEIIGSSRAEVSGVTIRNGREGLGGGILNGDEFTHTSTLILMDCIISANGASSGGGVGNGGSLEVRNCVIKDNTADGGGAGVFNGVGATLTLTESTVSGNGGPAGMVGPQGGGINNRGAMTLLRSTISGNTSGSEGGAGIWNAGQIEVVNSTISGNTVNGGGGGGIRNLGSVAIKNTTITENDAGGIGGILNSAGEVMLQNSILAGNKRFSFAGVDCGGAVTSGGHNLVGVDTECSITPSAGDLIGTSQNPIDPRLDGLRDNGGPTATHALLSDSPAFDAGSPASPGSGGGACEETDQRGVLRPVGPACDIGSFERVGPDTDGDGVHDDYDNCVSIPNGQQEDGDIDGVGDVCDNCPADANGDQADAVHPNGIGDACDDPDGDGAVDLEDVCPGVSDAGQEDRDGNGVGDACNDAEDGDGDEYADGLDNCPDASNSGQEDGDVDELGDVCDNCPERENADQSDVIHPNGIGDACDDTDGDGAFDLEDSCPDAPNPGQEDADARRIVALQETLVEVEPGVGFRVEGALRGASVEFSCAPCGVATFTDAVPKVGGDQPFCGYVNQVPRQIVLNDDRICMRSLASGARFDLDLISFRSGQQECVDADGGSSCAAAGGQTSFLLGDGAGDLCDNCPAVLNPLQTDDVHPNAIGDACDDPDHDGAFDAGDVCPDLSNPGQEDADEPPIAVDPGGFHGVEPGAGISVSGALYGVNVEFSCGPCAVATFEEDVIQIGGGVDFCGYIDQVPRQIVLNQDRVCMRSLSSGVRYELYLLSFRSGRGDCVDADGGATCAATGGRTSFRLADGVGDVCDNCPAALNRDQADAFHTNGIGDACDDPDADGVADLADVCPNIANPGQQESVACFEVRQDGGQCLEATVELAFHDARDGVLRITGPGAATPDYVSFEVLASSCERVDGVQFFLNGTLLGTFQDAFTSCVCSPLLQVLTVDDPAVLSAAWRLDGNNVFRITKPGAPSPPGTFEGTFVGWIRARIGAPAMTTLACLFDVGGGACSEPDLCAGGSTEDAVDQETTVPDPLPGDEVDLVTIPFQASSLPGVVDLSAVPDGPAKLCVTAQAEPELLGATSDGDLIRIDLTEGRALKLGRLPMEMLEIEFDPASGRAFAQGSEAFPVGQEFDVTTSRSIGMPIGTQGLFTALEFVGSRTFGAVNPVPGGPSFLAQASPFTGGLSLIGSTGRPGIAGLANDRSSGALYGVDEGLGFLLRIDPATGAATRIGPTFHSLGSLELGPDGRLYAGGSGPDAGKLFRLDTSTGRATLAGQVGAGAVTGLALVVSAPVSDCVGFVKQGERLLSINGAGCGPPTAAAGADARVECSSPAGAEVLLDGSASGDGDSTPGSNDDIVLFEWFEDFGTASQRPLGQGEMLSVVLPLGGHAVTLRVTDSSGSTASDSLLVQVVDTVAPGLTVGLDATILWPPNHRMVPVVITATASDRCDAAPSVVLVAVESSEPDDAAGAGDGHTTEDVQDAAVGQPEAEILLRAERAAEGGGRVYTLTYEARDESGNASQAAAGVLVPHDMGGSVEPITLDVTAPPAGGPGATLVWTPVAGVESYNVIRGPLSRISAVGSFTILEGAACIGGRLTAPSLAASGTNEVPAAGQAFYYLVESVHDLPSGYGTADGGREVVLIGGGGCPVDP